MTNKILLFAFVAFLFSSCKDWGWMEPKDPTQTHSSSCVQTIKGATDCVDNRGWSWMNGKATAAYYQSCIFSFVAAEEGVLMFNVHSNCLDDELIVSIGSVTLFNRENYYSYFDSYSVNCGIVHQGAKITFKGESHQQNNPLFVVDVKIIKSN